MAEKRTEMLEDRYKSERVGHRLSISNIPYTLGGRSSFKSDVIELNMLSESSSAMTNKMTNDIDILCITPKREKLIE